MVSLESENPQKEIDISPSHAINIAHTDVTLHLVQKFGANDQECRRVFSFRNKTGVQFMGIKSVVVLPVASLVLLFAMHIQLLQTLDVCGQGHAICRMCYHQVPHVHPW